jgi:regulator of sigma E protease
VTVLSGFLFTAVVFLAVIGPLIFLHELGHYLAGRWFGVKADVFAIGFGKELLGWTDRLGTRWKLCALPLGGYVKFAGDMNPASQPSADWLALPEAERNQTFQAKTLWQRAVIVAAGPITNFIVAIAIFTVFFAAYGQLRTPATIANVAAQSAAAAAGLQPGDKIIEIAGRKIVHFEDISRNVSIRPREMVDIAILRNGQPLTLSATIGVQREQDRFGNRFERGILGISPGERIIEPLPFYQVPQAAIAHSWQMLDMMITTIGQIISGRRSVEELGGPLKIAQYSSQQAQLGLINVIEFMALISINLGFINLLPIPMLDGGHLALYGAEAIRRKPLSAKVQEWAFRSGLAILLAFMVFVTINDLGSFGLWDHLAGLIGAA